MAATASAALLSLALHCGLSTYPATHPPLVESKSAFNTCAIGGVDKVLRREFRVADEAVMFEKRRAQKVVVVATADLDVILPGLTGGTTGSSANAPPPAPSPTYESWDVLRQYPRPAQVSQPSTAAPKPQESPKTTKENKDAQDKTVTE